MRQRDVSPFGARRNIRGELYDLYEEVSPRIGQELADAVKELKKEAAEEYESVRVLTSTRGEKAVYVKNLKNQSNG